MYHKIMKNDTADLNGFEKGVLKELRAANREWSRMRRDGEKLTPLKNPEHYKDPIGMNNTWREEEKPHTQIAETKDPSVGS